MHVCIYTHREGGGDIKGSIIKGNHYSQDNLSNKVQQEKLELVANSQVPSNRQDQHKAPLLL